MSWYFNVITNYATFSGRARRKEYWIFVLFNMIAAIGIGFCFGVVSAIMKQPAIGFLAQFYNLATIIPSLAVGVRRMHDTDHSGWWLLCPFYNLVLLCSEGTEGNNPHGPDPKKFERQQNHQAHQIGTSDAVSQLEKLARLKAQGHLTEEEFAAKKKQLLAS